MGCRVKPAPWEGWNPLIKWPNPLRGVRAGGLAASLGLANGDVIRAVGGLEIGSPDRLLEIYGKVRSLANLSVTVLRGRQVVTLAYTVK